MISNIQIVKNIINIINAVNIKLNIIKIQISYS
jgi:hypothetical protein